MYTAKHRLGLVFVLLSLLLLSACHHWQRSAFVPCRFRLHSGECWQAPVAKVADADLVATAYHAVDQLLQSNFRHRNPALHRDEAIIVTTLVDLNRLHRSSPLGRLLAEHMAARFTQAGYTVIEARLQEDLLYRQRDGEFVLSRIADHLRASYPVATLNLGTYSVAADKVYVTIKLVKENSIVIGSHSFTLPLGKNTRLLLGLEQ